MIISNLVNSKLFQVRNLVSTVTIYFPYFYSYFVYSSEDNKEDDITARRAQIAEKIHQTHQGIFRNNYQIQPVQTGQPNAR